MFFTIKHFFKNTYINNQTEWCYIFAFQLFADTCCTLQSGDSRALSFNAMPTSIF